MAAAGLLYAACVGLYQANSARTTIAALRQAHPRQGVVRALGWTILFIALWTLSTRTGWELAIPIWLAMLGAAGILNLLCAVYLPRIHPASGLLGLLTPVALLVASSFSSTDSVDASLPRSQALAERRICLFCAQNPSMAFKDRGHVDGGMRRW